jgi:hypothetical protein
VNQHNSCALVIMPLFMLLAIFPNPLSWQPLFFQIIFVCLKTRAKIYLWDKAFIKTKYLQNHRDLHSRVVPLFYKPIFWLVFIKGFQTPLRKLSKRDVMSPLVSEKSTKASLLYLKLFSNLTMAWSSLSTCSIIVSGDARSAANDWPCVVSWLRVTLFDFDELLVCRYDPQVGLWPNLLRTHQLISCPM